MRGAVDELAEEERAVFGLVRIQGMTQAEAARVLGVSPETVKRRWQQMCAVKAELDAPSFPRLLRGGCQGGVTPPAYPLRGPHGLHALFRQEESPCSTLSR